MTTLFVEQPLTFPGSAKYLSIIDKLKGVFKGGGGGCVYRVEGGKDGGRVVTNTQFAQQQTWWGSWTNYLPFLLHRVGKSAGKGNDSNVFVILRKTN